MSFTRTAVAWKNSAILFEVIAVWLIDGCGGGLLSAIHLARVDRIGAKFDMTTSFETSTMQS